MLNVYTEVGVVIGGGALCPVSSNDAAECLLSLEEGTTKLL